MNLKIKILLFVFSLFSLQINAQYKYANEISVVENRWNIIDLNYEILSKVESDFSDIRILSISDTDTVEVPYFFKPNNNIEEQKGVNFKIINKSNITDEHFFTLKLQDTAEINEIQLKFQQENFNWLVELQASQNQKEWFTILKEYRILAIKNNETDYNYTNLKFQKSEYIYYRIKIESKEKPILKYASLKSILKEKKHLNEVNNSFNSKIENKKTIVELTFEDRIPVSEVQLNFSNNLNFQRPINIEYLKDSYTVDNNIVNNYRSISRSYISSLEENRFEFGTVFTKKLRITINNYDNESLSIEDVITKVPNYRIIARFVHPENKHFIVYGTKNNQIPNYDIVNFKQDIPTDLKKLELKNQINLSSTQIDKSLTNKWWLWAILLIIIAMLGYSTVSMLNKK